MRDPAPRSSTASSSPACSPARSRISIAAAALAAVSFGVWDVLDGALGRGLGGQVVSLGVALGLGLLTYLGAAKLMRIAELDQIVRLLRRR